MLHLVRSGECDALSLGLSEIARALVCTGPYNHVRAYDAAADDFIVYGPAERPPCWPRSTRSSPAS
ncbi:hypothetical protein ABT072_45755 [Streptomyces sp. NPDC002589]|uniref:hypothetical protein n=1 Tax=Streptomyces sp. NPDC002589 TaxID=3154420 RepID=UPI00332F4074